MKKIYIRNICCGVKINTGICALDVFNKSNVISIIESCDKLFNLESNDINEMINDGSLIEAYQINDEYALSIDHNIYLYYLGRKEDYLKYKEFTNWYYPQNEIYLGDSWYFEDEEILKDLKEQDALTFLVKYYFGK